MVFSNSFLPIVSTNCDYCNKEFSSIGRHLWRCPSRVTGPAQPQRNLAVQGEFENSYQGNIAASLTASTNDPAVNTLNAELITCSCGRLCKGRRGLVAHQRTCRMHKDFLEDPTGSAADRKNPSERDNGDREKNDNRTNLNPYNANEMPNDSAINSKTIPGLLLPKTDYDGRRRMLSFI